MSPRRFATLAALTLVAACRTATSTTTTISGTPRLEPAPATVQAPPAAAPASAGAFDPSGRWNLVFDFQGQGLEVVLELVKTPDGGYAGTLSSQMGNTPLSKVTLVGTKMEAAFSAPDGSAGVMTLNFEGTKVTGTWAASGMGSTLSGARP